MSKNAVIGLLSSYGQAERTVDALLQAGFANNDISVLFPDKEGTRDFAHEKNTKAPEGAVMGAGAGGTIGGTIGLLAGIGALAIPGVGPLIAAGPIMAALSGAAAGAAVGGLAGALVGMGIPEIEAKQYEGKVKGGKMLVSVHVENGDARTRAKKVLESMQAEDISTVGEEGVPKRDQPAPPAH